MIKNNKIQKYLLRKNILLMKSKNMRKPVSINMLLLELYSKKLGQFFPVDINQIKVKW